MILRQTRGTLRPNSEARIFDLLRVAAATAARPPGLEALFIGRAVRHGSVEIVATSVWRDMDAMIAGLGPSWREPSWLAGLAPYISDSSVELLETVLSSYLDLTAFDLPDDAENGAATADLARSAATGEGPRSPLVVAESSHR